MGDSPARRHYLTGLGLAAAGAVLFASKAIVIKLSYAYPIEAVGLLALRMAFAVPIYLAIALVLRQLQPAVPLSRRQWLAVVALGLCGYYLASLLDLMGLQYISAGLERLILYVYPTLVLLLSRLLFGRAIGRIELVALALCYAGLALVVAEDLRLYAGDTLLGGLLVFGSAAAFAVFMLGSGRLIPSVGSMRFTCIAMSAAGAGVGAHFLLAQPVDLLALPTPVYVLGAVLAIGCTVLPSFMMAAGVARIGAERASLIGMIGPAATLLMGWAVLGEPVTLVHAAGTALILVGMLQLGRRRQQPAPAPGGSPVRGA